MKHTTDSHNSQHSRLAQVLDLKYLLPSITTGFLIGVLIVNAEISYGALIFSGELSEYVQRGIGFTLFGGFIIGLFTALKCTLPCTISRPQDSPAAILAISASAIATQLPVSPGNHDAFVTIVTLMILTTLLTGLSFWLVGRFRLGNFVRFIPYPVMGGFLAGIGWIVVEGAMRTLTGDPFKISQFLRLFSPDMIGKWLPACLLAILLMVFSSHYKHFLVIPAMLLSAIALFYLFLFVSGMSIAQARESGWLLGTFSKGSLWRPLPPSAFVEASWPLIMQQWGNICTIILLSMTSFLLSATGIELATRYDLDLNDELRTVGIANILAGAGGSHVGFHSTSRTVLAYKMETNTRLVGIISAFSCGIAILYGNAFLAYLPKYVVGGSLLFIGFGLLFDWVYLARHKFPRRDYVFMLGILMITLMFGFLKGVFGGILIAGVLFVLDYSGISVIKNRLSGSSYRSNFDRPPQQEEFLKVQGKRIGIFKLQGFLFFGTAHILFNTIKEEIKTHSEPSLHSVIFDFKHVTGLDSSATYSFTKLKHVIMQHRLTLVLTDLSKPIVSLFEQQGVISHNPSGVQVFQDLDHGLEWCENQLLASEQIPLGNTCYPLMSRLTDAGIAPNIITELVSYFEKYEVEAGYYLIRQGGEADDIYYIESGLAVARLEMEHGKHLRLRTLGPGTFTGEIGMYRHHTRSASVVTKQNSVFYRISRTSLESMTNKFPASAMKFQEELIRIMAERLSKNSETIQALID